jgi:hypothetical protein
MRGVGVSPPCLLGAIGPQAHLIAGRSLFDAGHAYITVMGHRKHPKMKLDEVLTDIFAGLVIAALIAGVVAQMHT